MVKSLKTHNQSEQLNKIEYKKEKEKQTNKIWSSENPLTDRGANAFWETWHMHTDVVTARVLFMVQHDYCHQTDLWSELTWQMKSVISWKTTVSCISKDHLRRLCAPDAHVNAEGLICPTWSTLHTHMWTYSYEATCRKQTINFRWHMDFIPRRGVTGRRTHSFSRCRWARCPWLT